MRLPRIAAAALLLGLVPLAACGDDDDTGGGGSEGGALTKAEYIAAADEICADVESSGEDLEAPAQGDVEALAEYLTDALAVYEDAKVEFEALEPPADGEEVHAGQLEQVDEAITGLSDALALAEDGDYEGAVGVIAGIEPDPQRDQVAANYGLDDCTSQEPTE